MIYLRSMIQHLALVDDHSAAEHAATLKAFEWAIDVLGILPNERRVLLHGAGPADPDAASQAIARETRIRRIVSIADDARALLADEDEVREWLRSPNPGLWTRTRCPVMTTPLRVMLDYEDGVRAVCTQLSSERRRKFPRGWLS